MEKKLSLFQFKRWPSGNRSVVTFLTLWALCCSYSFLNLIRKQLSSLLIPAFDGDNALYSASRTLLTSSVSVLFSTILLKQVIQLRSRKQKVNTHRNNLDKTPGATGVSMKPLTNDDVTTLPMELCDDKEKQEIDTNTSLLASSCRQHVAVNTRVCEDMADNPSVEIGRQSADSETQTDLLDDKHTSTIGTMTSSLQVVSKAINTSQRPHSVARGTCTVPNGLSKKKIRRAQKSLEEMEIKVREERLATAQKWFHSIKKYRDKIFRMMKTADDKSKMMGYVCTSRMATQKDVENTAFYVRSLKEKLSQQCQQNDKQYNTIKTKTAIVKTMSQFIGVAPAGVKDSNIC